MKTSTPPPGRVLVVDDREDTLKALSILLKSNQLHYDAAASPSLALEQLGREPYDVVLMDLNYSRDTTSGREGLNLLNEVRARDHVVSIVVMTAWSSVEVAVEAMRRGANDFIEKPWDNERLLSILKTQIELVRARRDGARLAEENRLLRGAVAETDFIATSPAMQPLLNLIERVGPSEESILITGENGVGKGVVAKMLHAASLRADEALVTVNAGSLSASVFESELFGHVAGAFTDAKMDRLGRFELADGGTLFLDEIANVPLELQSKLLHVAETGEFEPVGSSQRRRTNARLISATNANLSKEVAKGRFREDLYYRLNAIELHVPPLRDRPEDILALAELFLSRHAARYRREIRGISSAAGQALSRYGWPGNVRELDHTMARAVLMSTGTSICPDDLGLRGAETEILDMMTLEEVERSMIEKALNRCNGSVHAAAQQLGLSRSALYRRLQKFGLGESVSEDAP